MHAVFMLYGKKENVEMFIRDMSAQKYQLTYKKEGEEDKKFWIDGQVRLLPFGIYEHIFPKTSMDMVLTTLRFHKEPPYNIGQEIEIPIIKKKIRPLDYLKKYLDIEDIPDFKTDHQLIWLEAHVGIIPIGIRYDGEMTNPEGKFMAGWTNEAI